MDMTDNKYAELLNETVLLVRELKAKACAADDPAEWQEYDTQAYGAGLLWWTLTGPSRRPVDVDLIFEKILHCSPPDGW